MNNELWILTEEQTNALIEQKKQKPQETFENNLNRQWETF